MQFVSEPPFLPIPATAEQLQAIAASDASLAQEDRLTDGGSIASSTRPSRKTLARKGQVRFCVLQAFGSSTLPSY